MTYEGHDWHALTRDAVTALNDGYLELAQATALVGMSAALSEIAYGLRDENCDSPLIQALERLDPSQREPR